MALAALGTQFVTILMATCLRRKRHLGMNLRQLHLSTIFGSIGLRVAMEAGTSIDRINPPFEFKGPGLIHFHNILVKPVF